jgi:hypothetical protein
MAISLVSADTGAWRTSVERHDWSGTILRVCHGASYRHHIITACLQSWPMGVTWKVAERDDGWRTVLSSFYNCASHVLRARAVMFMLNSLQIEEPIMSMPSSSATKATARRRFNSANVRGTCDIDRVKIISNGSKDTTLHIHNTVIQALRPSHRPP